MGLSSGCYCLYSYCGGGFWHHHGVGANLTTGILALIQVSRKAKSVIIPLMFCAVLPGRAPFLVWREAIAFCIGASFFSRFWMGICLGL